MLGEKLSVSQKYWSNLTVFVSDKDLKFYWAPNEHIWIILKDHVTLKTGVMAAENYALSLQE